MSFVAAGIAGASAGIGAGASAGGGMMGKSSAKKAKRTAAKSIHAASVDINDSLKTGTSQLEQGYEDAAGGLENYANLGEGALAKLAYGLGFDVPGFDTSGLKRGSLLKNFSEEDFRADPGYEFVRSEGQRGIQNSAAARGSVLSGATLKALTRFNQGTADQQYSKSYERFNTDRKTQADMLASMAGRGQLAKTQQGVWRQGTSLNQSNIREKQIDRITGLHMASAGVNMNTALRKGNYAQGSIGGIGKSAQSFLGSKSFGSIFS